jgi:hypothetical protein
MKARHPNLLDYPGRFVAIDEATDRVVADAATLVDLWELIRDRDLKVSIMRAPARTNRSSLRLKQTRSATQLARSVRPRSSARSASKEL